MGSPWQGLRTLFNEHAMFSNIMFSNISNMSNNVRKATKGPAHPPVRGPRPYLAWPLPRPAFRLFGDFKFFWRFQRLLTFRRFQRFQRFLRLLRFQRFPESQNPGASLSRISEPGNYTKLHYTTPSYTTPNYTTLHHTKLHYTTLPYTKLHYTRKHCITPNYTTLHYTPARAPIGGRRRRRRRRRRTNSENST